MTRIAIFLSALVLALTAGAAQARVMGDEKDVAKVVSFGGSCAKCELSGKKLTNARFIGAILNRVNIHRHSYYYAPYYRKEYGKYYQRSPNQA